MSDSHLVTASDVAWTVEPLTPRRAAVLDQLAAEIRDSVAICVVSAIDRRVLAYRGPDAFAPEQLGEAVYELAGAAIDATRLLGGDDLFGVVRDGSVLTESAAIHYRVVGGDRAIVVISDAPAQPAHLEVTRRVLVEYDGFVRDLTTVDEQSIEPAEVSGDDPIEPAGTDGE